jgi:long-chain acyl-CoA synthetase
MAYLATVRLGAIAVPILPDFLDSDVHHILNEVKPKTLFTTKYQIEKIYEIPDKNSIRVITLDNYCCDSAVLKTIPLEEYLNKTADLPESLFEESEKKSDSIAEDDVASLIYTSGTSGHSKAVLLTHKNLVSNVQSVNYGVCPIVSGWVFLSILPMSHTYEFSIGFLLPLSKGCKIVYAGKSPSPKILEQICHKEQPNIICIVPMVIEKIYKKRILAKVESSRLLKTITRFSVVRKKIYKKIAAKLLHFFGGKLELLAIGGAPLNNEVEKFLYESGFPYLVGYGLTETSPLLAAGPFKDPSLAVGSTGKPIPGVEIKIVGSDPETGIGEIYALGPNVMQGYYNNPEETDKTITKDGWLATGDLGYFDKQNNLVIKGRSKSVIVLSSGENIYPEAIEEKINSEIHVVESLVTENKNQLEAWVYLDYDLVDAETEGKSQKEKLEYITDILQKIKAALNPQLPIYSKISRVVEREEPFIKTATHKIKRYLYSKPN